MGIFSVPIQVGDRDAHEFREVTVLVDTGASHTLLPAPFLRELGVEPHAKGRFQLASGEIVSRDIGRAWVKLDGQREITIVVFGDEASPALLGAVTLEEFGLGVEPIAKRLISVPRMLL
jgi:clan AA aspartic protease